MRFAERLKELRERAGMTQAQLAKACEIPLGTLRDYEQGTRRSDPSLRIAAKLATTLGVSLDLFAECVSVEAEARRSKPKKPRPRARKGK